MTSDFPSVNDLTWQEWRATHYPMDSAANQANRLQINRSAVSEAPGTLSTEVEHAD